MIWGAFILQLLDSVIAIIKMRFIRPNTLNKQRGTLVRMKIELKSFLEPLIEGQNSDTVVVNEISANQEP